MALSTIMSAMTPSGSTATLVNPASSTTNAASSSSHLHGGFNSGTNHSNAGSSNNPVSALMAGRTTLAAPPSLSTVNHSDAHTGSRTRDRIQRLAGRSNQVSARPDLQQALSPATAAVPVSTRENISTSQGWSIPPSSSTATPLKPPILAHTPAENAASGEEFKVHSAFRKDAEQRGDVLVRVEGVEFYVHKHILMFSSPFFASLLEGEWKESQLEGQLEDSETSSEGSVQSTNNDEQHEQQQSHQQTDDELEVLADGVSEDADEGANANQDESEIEVEAVPSSGRRNSAQGEQGSDQAQVDRYQASPEPESCLVSPLSETPSDYSVAEERAATGQKGSTRASTVRCSYHTAEYHFEGIEDTADDEVRGFDRSRQDVIAHAQRALEGEGLRGDLDEAQPKATSSVAPVPCPPIATPFAYASARPQTATNSDVASDQAAGLEASGAGDTTKQAAVHQSRRRSASLDSSHRNVPPSRNHKPKARSIALQSKVSKKIGEDPAVRAIPTRTSSKSFDLAVSAKGRSSSQERDSEPSSPLARFESLATPPGSPAPPSNSASAFGSADSTVQRLPRASSETLLPLRRRPKEHRSKPSGIGAGSRTSIPDKLVAVVDLEEETPSTFHNFLYHVYPHLDLHVTWFNCGPLLRFADKFQVPYLRRSCITFLKTALPGRPIEAMRLAELHGLHDQYKEASRHVLDNYSEWYPEEFESLSKETLLKLERKRTWFLERMLKLGLCSPARDYECHAHCPDPQNCARLLQEKWQTAYANTFRFAPPQPSAIFRHLRDLDGAPFLAMSACQSTARAWVRLLFDRMFSIDTLHTPRQFLCVRLEGLPVRGVGKEA